MEIAVLFFIWKEIVVAITHTEGHATKHIVREWFSHFSCEDKNKQTQVILLSKIYVIENGIRLYPIKMMYLDCNSVVRAYLIILSGN